MRESLRLYIKNCDNFDTKYISLIFVASSKLLDKNFHDINITVEKIMKVLIND